MLKYPQRNFGFLPSNETLAHIAFVTIVAIIPLLSMAGYVMMGREITESNMAAIIPRLILVALYGWYLYATPGGWRQVCATSKRRRYVQTVLAPYFRKRYKVRLKVSGDRADAVFFGRPLQFKGKNAPVEAYVHGWLNIEAVADGVELGEPLEKCIYIIQIMENGSAREIPLRNGNDEERESFMSQEQHDIHTRVPALNETEDGIKAMVSGMIQSLPAGEATLRCIAPAASEMGVESEMKVQISDDETLTYSLKEMHSVVEALLFNVRLAESAMVVCIVEAASGKKYICGQIVRNMGYSDVPADLLREISDAEELSDFIFVKNIQEMR